MNSSPSDGTIDARVVSRGSGLRAITSNSGFAANTNVSPFSETMYSLPSAWTRLPQVRPGIGRVPEQKAPPDVETKPLARCRC